MQTHFYANSRGDISPSIVAPALRGLVERKRVSLAINPAVISKITTPDPSAAPAALPAWR